MDGGERASDCVGVRGNMLIILRLTDMLRFIASTITTNQSLPMIFSVGRTHEQELRELLCDLFVEQSLQMHDSTTMILIIGIDVSRTRRHMLYIRTTRIERYYPSKQPNENNQKQQLS